MGWYFRVYALVEVLRNALGRLLVPRHWGRVVGQLSPGMHLKGQGLRGGFRRSEAGGWRGLGKRLRAVTVSYNGHWSWHLP